MKFSIKYILIICLLFSTSGCKKFLGTDPEDFVSPQFYYNTQEQIEFALNGVYDVLGNRSLYQYQMLARMGLEADEGFYNRSAVTTGLQMYVFDASDSELTNLWEALYDGINRANTLLENIHKPTMSETARDVIRGEALFLRAWYYFLLVKNWGDVPLILTATSSVEDHQIKRSLSKEVYERITLDMEAAEKLVLKSAETKGKGGKINKSAVAGVLSRVYLHWAGYPLKDVSKYEKAREWALVVMKPENGHDLNPSFQQVFINYALDEYDERESIWEIEFYGNGMDIYTEYGHVGNVNGIAATATSSIGYSTALLNATQHLYDLYEAGDERRDWSIAPFRYSENSKVIWGSHQIYNRNCGKWRREYEELLPKTNHGTPQNFPLLRYSDVLLMFAEAENFINGPTTPAFQALNKVRGRAKASLYNEQMNISKVAFQAIIMDERSRELCFETWRKGDLIRTEKFIDAMEALELELKSNGGTFDYGALSASNVTQRNLLYPIPTRELSLNRSLTQNPGW